MSRFLALFLALLLAVPVSSADQPPADGAKVPSAKETLRAVFERAKVLQPADFPAYLATLVEKLQARDAEFAFAYAMTAARPPFPSDSAHPGAWRQFLRTTLADALGSPATTPDLREVYRTIEVALLVGEEVEEGTKREAHERRRAMVERLAADYPQNPAVEAFAALEMMMLVASDGARADAWGAKLAGSPSLGLAKVGKGRMATVAGRTKPVEAKFTALDGREVDLANLRGKVVLIDFWATWCGPCVAELPNVKRVYEAYRDQGFEVIGVTQERAMFLPGDTPAVRAEKLAAARKKLADYVASKGLTWPQKLEGDFGSDLVARYNIIGIPATLLLDRNGLVVNDAGLRGEKLETEVKRLLKL